MKNLIALLTILSASLTGCAGAPKRPQGAIGQFNARSSYVRTYDFEHFDADIKYHATPANIPFRCEDLHGYWVMKPESKESLQAYALQWKQRYLQLKEKCD